jgi:hypothetical protein
MQRPLEEMLAVDPTRIVPARLGVRPRDTPERVVACSSTGFGIGTHRQELDL